MSFFSKLFESDPVAELKPFAEKVNGLEAGFEKKSQDDLRALTLGWRKEIESSDFYKDLESGNEESRRNAHRALNKYLDGILPEAFAAVREAGKRALSQRHFDVQIIGATALHQGRIAEMKTGEGKTLSATLAVYLNALSGKGVHVVTVNDYLSRRDASWMGQVYDYLGLSVGVIQHANSFRFEKETEEVMPTDGTLPKMQRVVLDVKNLQPCSRKEAYACDITYGTNNEFGFDYLRDNMANSLQQKSQRFLNYAIVDEVDSILIDEARTPLIISAPDSESTEKYFEFAKYVEKLDETTDYNIDEKKKSAALTEEGIAKLEKMLGVENIYVDKGIITVHHLEQALRAKTLFKRDRDYVVREGEIVIVDEFTGRMLPGRRYSEGLHQAIEAKEGVAVQRESKTLASITFQNYFRLYAKLAGMTGTAKTEEEEFRKIYSLDVVVVPTNNPIARIDQPDAVFKSEKGKYEAIVKEVKSKYDHGQPVLIGTISIEKNEMISALLARAGVPHEVLNAKNHENEAKIIAQAGREKAVTLATNIAGRGVDILLGGAPFDQQSYERVKSLGGLHVLGTERHESRRIDNQLRGRSGRQGDPGSTQFYVSLEDDLIRLFGGERVQNIMNTLGLPEDMPIEHSMVSRVIESAQKKIEGLNFDTRKHVLEYDDVMNKHREVIYRIRNRILQPEANLKDEILEKVRQEIRNVVAMYTQGSSDEWNMKEIYETMFTIFPFDRNEAQKFKTTEELENHFISLAEKTYEQKEEHLTVPVMRQIEKIVTLQSIDSLWVEHLDTMEHVRQSVRLRGYAQKDPLVEYKREGLTQFEKLLSEIDRGVVYTIYKVELRTNTPKQTAYDQMSQGRPIESSAKSATKIGRNDPCPCGSGKKYKKCGMLNTEEHQKLMSK